jgi:hypothetical protein
VTIDLYKEKGMETFLTVVGVAVGVWVIYVAYGIYQSYKLISHFYEWFEVLDTLFYKTCKELTDKMLEKKKLPRNKTWPLWFIANEHMDYFYKAEIVEREFIWKDGKRCRAYRLSQKGLRKKEEWDAMKERQNTGVFQPV